MLIAWIEREPTAAWKPGLSALTDALAAAGHEVRRASHLADASAADAYLVIAPPPATMEEIVDAAAKAPDRLRQTLLIGVPIDFSPGFPRATEGSIAALLERHKLGGAFAPEALTDWQDAPSSFAGPKALMNQFDTNAVKLLQSEAYANWFAVRGRSLAEFLCHYLPVLSEHIRATR